MEEQPINEIDYTTILEEIQINSYNIDNQLKKLNQELITDTTTSSAITINQAVKEIHSSINLLTAVMIIFVVLQLIKLRGEKR